MNLVMPATPSTIAAVRALAPEIERRSDEIEAGRGIPTDLIGRLRSAGLFRMALPKSLGGDELKPIEISRILENLAYADASTAWVGMVAVGFNKCIGQFPVETLEEVFADTPDVLIRGAIAPKGVLRPVEGGYLASGQWSLGSGSFEPEWVLGNCLVLASDGTPNIQNGRPEMRAILVPGKDVAFLDTWDSVGLRGTQSHDFVLKETFVDSAHTAVLFGPSNFENLIQRLPMDVFTAPTHASVAIGIAQGAIDDLIALSLRKKPAWGGGKTLDQDPMLARDLGLLGTRLAGLRAFAETVMTDLWFRLENDLPIEPHVRAGASAMASYVQHEATDIVSEVFSLGGASVCYNSSRIARRWRDIRCVAQHIAASKAAYSTAGNAMLGHDLSGIFL